jgi:hypothetical protein
MATFVLERSMQQGIAKERILQSSFEFERKKSTHRWIINIIGCYFAWRWLLLLTRKLEYYSLFSGFNISSTGVGIDWSSRQADFDEFSPIDLPGSSGNRRGIDEAEVANTLLNLQNPRNNNNHLQSSPSSTSSLLLPSNHHLVS